MMETHSSRVKERDVDLDDGRWDPWMHHGAAPRPSGRGTWSKEPVKPVASDQMHKVLYVRSRVLLSWARICWRDFWFLQ